MIEQILNFDKNLFLIVNQSGITSLDSLMLFITNKFSSIPIYLFLVFLIFKYERKKAFLILTCILLLIVLTDQGSVKLFKNTFERLRPCHVMDNIRLVKENCGGKFGFISSHAANTFGLALFLSKIFRKNIITITLIFWASIISFSRIYIGVHYPIDILGGFFWGLICAFFVIYIYKILNKKYV